MSPANLAEPSIRTSQASTSPNSLVVAGLVEQTREEKVRNMVQPYYHATAHRFIISYSLTESLAKDDGYAQWHEKSLQKMIMGLEVFGIKIPEEKRARVIELMDDCVEMERKAFEEVVEQQSDPEKLENVQRPSFSSSRTQAIADAEHITVHEPDKTIGLYGDQMNQIKKDRRG
jgi:hypothetical protein